MYIGYRSPCLSGVYRRVALHIAQRIFKSWPARDDLFETTDRNNGIKELQEGVEENIRFARQIDEAKKAATEPYLVEAHIGAHAPFTVPDAGLEMLREAVKATGRGLHIHAAEDLTTFPTVTTGTAKTCWHDWRNSISSTAKRWSLMGCTCRKMTSPYSISAMRSWCITPVQT